MEKTFNVMGIKIPRVWPISDCTNHPEVVDKITKEVTVVLVCDNKLKIFGKDRDGIIRKKCWPLLTPHKVSEANSILLKEFGVSIPIEKIETEADKILNGSNKRGQKKSHLMPLKQPVIAC